MKQRVYLKRTNASEFLYLAWFRLEESHDLYWGPPSAGLDIANTVIEPDGTSGLLDLSAPEGWEKARQAHHKHSYHQSGRRHTTAEGSGAAAIHDSVHEPLSALTDPALLCGVLTAVPAHYPPYTRSLNRHKSAAVVLQMMDDDQWFRMRHYFEFYVARAGTFLPPPLIKVGATYRERPPAFSSFSEDLDRILAIRHIQVPLDGRNDDVGFWIVPSSPLHND